MTAGNVKLRVASSLLIRTRIDNDWYTDVPCERQSVWSYLGSWSWSLWNWHPVGPSATLRRCRRKPPNWERSWRSFPKVFAWSMRSIWFCTPWGGADWWVKVRVANMGRNRPTWSTCNLSCAKNMKKIQREAWIWVSGFSRAELVSLEGWEFPVVSGAVSRSELNFPIGPKNLIDFAPHRWQIPLHLLEGIFISCSLIKAWPLSKVSVLSPGITVIHFCENLQETKDLSQFFRSNSQGQMNTESRGRFSTSKVSCNLARPGSWRHRSALRTVPWPRISWRKSQRPLRMAPKNWRCNDRLTWCCWTWNFMMRGGLILWLGMACGEDTAFGKMHWMAFPGRIPVVFKVLLHTPRLLDLIQKVRWESVRSIAGCLRWCFSCFLPIESQLHSTHSTHSTLAKPWGWRKSWFLGWLCGWPPSTWVAALPTSARASPMGAWVMLRWGNLVAGAGGCWVVKMVMRKL